MRLLQDELLVGGGEAVVEVAGGDDLHESVYLADGRLTRRTMRWTRHPPASGAKEKKMSSMRPFYHGPSRAYTKVRVPSGGLREAFLLGQGSHQQLPPVLSDQAPSLPEVELVEVATGFDPAGVVGEA